MVREGGEVTCEETEKVQWTGEAGEGYHQPGWLDFFHLPFCSKPGCLSIFIYNFDQNQVVGLLSFCIMLPIFTSPNFQHHYLHLAC